jgi:hypothetical protein
MTYNLPQQNAGDTWQGISAITITRNGSALDLTGAYAEFLVKFQIDAPTMVSLDTIKGGVTILSPASAGIITIPPQIIDIPPAIYQWALVVTLSSGEVDTFVNGNWSIVKLI